MKHVRLLVVDADEDLQSVYRESLADVGPCELDFAADAVEGLQRSAAESFDLVIAAIAAPDMGGLELLRGAKEADPNLPVVIVTDKPDTATAIESLRLGAADYLTKPLDGDALCASVRRQLGLRRIGDEHELLRRQVERPYSFDDIIGTCPAMRRVFQTIEQVADADVDVLVVGDTGTGKELVARSLHRRSRRAAKSFVPVDCGAIPENLLEAEFFGHERGAFTGADARRIGLLEFADEGTFFLDELGELPAVLQAKLLRTLQERKIRRVGGHEEIDIDVRVVAATARDLDTMVAAGQFRKDLYYRINVVRIDLPPLAARGDDLGLLAEYFAAKYSREMGRPITTISPEAYQVLAHYSWPGNVRELQNVIRRAIALSTERMIGVGDLPDALVIAAGQSEQSPAGGPLGYFQLRDQHMARYEKQYLVDLLTRHHGEVRSASVEARLPRGTLYRLLKNHGIDAAAFR